MLRATAFVFGLACSASLGAACSSATFQVASQVADGGTEVSSTDAAPPVDAAPDAFVELADATADLDEVAVYKHALAQKSILAHWAHRRS